MHTRQYSWNVGCSGTSGGWFSVPRRSSSRSRRCDTRMSEAQYLAWLTRLRSTTAGAR